MTNLFITNSTFHSAIPSLHIYITIKILKWKSFCSSFFFDIPHTHVCPKQKKKQKNKKDVKQKKQSFYFIHSSQLSVRFGRKLNTSSADAFKSIFVCCLLSFLFSSLRPARSSLWFFFNFKKKNKTNKVNNTLKNLMKAGIKIW